MTQHMRFMKKLVSKDFEKIKLMSEKPINNSFKVTDIREDTVTTKNNSRVTFMRCYIETEDSGSLANVGWVINENVSICLVCEKDFGLLKRWRHHCRACGDLVCTNCSKFSRGIKGRDKLGKFKMCENCNSLEEPRASFVQNWQSGQVEVVELGVELQPNNTLGKSLLNKNQDSKLSSQSMEISNPDEPVPFDATSFP